MHPLSGHFFFDITLRYKTKVARGRSEHDFVLFSTKPLGFRFLYRVSQKRGTLEFVTLIFEIIAYFGFIR